MAYSDREKILLGTVVVLVVIIIIGIIFFIYYYLRNRRRNPEEGRLLSAEEGRLQRENNEHEVELLPGCGVCCWQNQERHHKEKDELQGELDELQAELRRIQTEKDELQVELNELQVERNELQGELDWRRAHTYADHITLNPDTAHPNLSISGDKKFTHEPQPQKVPPTLERFDSTVCVLGSEGFSSGEHYWEVDVRSSNDWDLGVARKSIERKGKLSLSPKEGFWALGFSGRDYWAKTDPWTRIMVQKKPKKIGVYINYQDSQVTFFNVTHMSVLFTFNNCSFSGEVYPFFKNSHKETSMRICSIREDEGA